MTRKDREGEEARRILDRVARETDPSGSLAARATARAKAHLSAADADQEDPVEIWGTRIGRGIGVVLMVGLILWLLSLLAGG